MCLRHTVGFLLWEPVCWVPGVLQTLCEWVGSQDDTLQTAQAAGFRLPL